MLSLYKHFHLEIFMHNSSGSGGPRGHPPGPVKISNKKDGRRRWPHRFHVSRPPYPAAGSATAQFRAKQDDLSITLSSARATCHRQAYHLWLVRKCLQNLERNVNHLINESITGHCSRAVTQYGFIDLRIQCEPCVM